MVESCLNFFISRRDVRYVLFVLDSFNPAPLLYFLSYETQSLTSSHCHGGQAHDLDDSGAFLKTRIGTTLTPQLQPCFGHVDCTIAVGNPADTVTDPTPLFNEQITGLIISKSELVSSHLIELKYTIIRVCASFHWISKEAPELCWEM
jgi:hypothetical protein